MAVGSEVLRSLGAYLKAQFQNAVIILGLYILGFALTAVPWWPLVGLVSGLLNIIPYAGALLALIIPLMVKWTVTSDWVQLAYVAGVWLIIQVIEGFVLSPRAASRAGVHPLLSIVITVAAGFLFGPIGILLAVPVVAVLLVIRRAARSKK